jgi:hypothetical protein
VLLILAEKCRGLCQPLPIFPIKYLLHNFANVPIESGTSLPSSFAPHFHCQLHSLVHFRMDLQQIGQIAEEEFDQLCGRNTLHDHWVVENFVQNFQVPDMGALGVEEFWTN